MALRLAKLLRVKGPSPSGTLEQGVVELGGVELPDTSCRCHQEEEQEEEPTLVAQRC